ncbi:MAG: isocitrate/isopropylmalate family dehydrogenase, partial [Verrucomicrobiales bacterium]
SVAEACGRKLEVQKGGPIGRDAERDFGTPLPQEIIDFCTRIFSVGGAVICGPGGGRFVYDMRKVFDLYFKISPLRLVNGLTDASVIRPERLDGVDILLVRENSGGIYQGNGTSTSDGSSRLIRADHRFEYTIPQVTRFLQAALSLARSRKGKLTVVWKESGVPEISRLWKECLEDVAAGTGVETRLVDVDLMAYLLISEPSSFDVVAAPNLFGDVLGDLGAVLLGSRGISYSGNFAATGESVYQTNHGAAYDLAGTGTANPAGQIFSMAMLLRESFGLWREAAAIEMGVKAVWQEGWRTRDVLAPGTRLISTDKISDLMAERASEYARLDSTVI